MMINSPAHILVVDDEKGPRESLKMIFKPQYHVLTAPEGNRALEILKERPVDIVILDLRMPGLPGTKVLEKIREIDPDIEVVIVTGYASFETAVEGLRLGAFDYVSKPFDVFHLQEVVRRAIDRRKRLQRLKKIKEEILANFSHELRTPLNAIMGYSEILTHELRQHLNEKQQLLLQRLNVNSRELAALIENLLYLAYLDAGEVSLSPTTVALHDIIQQVAEAERGEAQKKGLDIRVAVHEPIFLVTDALMVRKLLEVLTSNAVKFTQQGYVTITAHRSANDRSIEIRVRDTGIGMKNEEIAFVMEGFYQVEGGLRRQYRGMGLGLRMATKLVSLLGGHTAVTSAVQEGTEFRISLPAEPHPSQTR